MRRTTWLEIAIACLAFGTPAAAGAVFQGAEQTATLDCKGGAAVIDGADNIMTLSGNCTRLTLRGAGNRVSISLAAQSVIEIQGADNEVRWTAPAKSKPVLKVAGADNSVVRAVR